MIVICVQTLAPTTGSGQFTNDVVNLKHQGAGQKLMIGWHKHQGVSETPKSADVICEQPLREPVKKSVKISTLGDRVKIENTIECL